MTKVTCAFAEARISKENSVLTVMVYKCLFSGVALGQAGSPHAGELSVGEQRGGFTGYRLCRRPLQNSMNGWLDDMMSAGSLQAAGLGWGWQGWAGEEASGNKTPAVACIERLQT